MAKSRKAILNLHFVFLLDVISTTNGLMFRFVLVCGHITFTSMENFLKDFLHEDRVSSDSFYDADVLIVDKYAEL